MHITLHVPGAPLTAQGCRACGAVGVITAHVPGDNAARLETSQKGRVVAKRVRTDLEIFRYSVIVREVRLVDLAVAPINCDEVAIIGINVTL